MQCVNEEREGETAEVALVKLMGIMARNTISRSFQY